MIPATYATPDAYNNTGNVVKKREDTHRMAQANRAFAHTLLKDDSKAGHDLDAAVNMGVDRKLLEDKMAEYRERAL